jgi:hypothetical protein
MCLAVVDTITRSCLTITPLKLVLAQSASSGEMRTRELQQRRGLRYGRPCPLQIGHHLSSHLFTFLVTRFGGNALDSARPPIFRSGYYSIRSTAPHRQRSLGGLALVLGTMEPQLLRSTLIPESRLLDSRPRHGDTTVRGAPAPLSRKSRMMNSREIPESGMKMPYVATLASGWPRDKIKF